jgi:putative transposase
MSHSFHKIWIHAIWSTKERLPLIEQSIEKKLHQFISKQFLELGCFVRAVNGMHEHVHCLFLLNPQKTIAEVMKTVKGSSSHYINQNDLITAKFAWQTGYAAFSVSESTVERVCNYIHNQKQHHSKQDFTKEYDAFLSLYGLGDTL